MPCHGRYERRRLLRCDTHTAKTRGFILLPVVVAITLVATLAFLISYESAMESRKVGARLEAVQAHYAAQAGLEHANWFVQGSGCIGDATMTAVPLGAHSYSGSVTAGGGSNTAYDLSVDQDAWIRSDDVDRNNGANADQHIRFESGKIEQSLFRFGLSSLSAGAKINSASAWFYVKSTGAHPEGPLTVHKVTADWTEAGATWASLNGSFESQVLGSIAAQSSGDVWVRVNLTAQVQAWVNGEPNYGILLRSTAEGVHTMYISREGPSNQHPRLEVVVGNAPASPVTIQATGTTSGGVTRTLSRNAVMVYQPAASMTLQPDAAAGKDTWISEWKTTWNYGKDDSLTVDGEGTRKHSLLQFNLSAIPAGARVLTATLSLYQNNASSSGGTVEIRQILSNWTEGTQWASTGAVNWTERDTGIPWVVSGGDYSPATFARTTLPAGIVGWFEWDVTSLVGYWVAGTYNNDGLALMGGGSGNDFTSSDDNDSSLHPKLTVTYACKCGSACLAPQGSGRIALIGDDSSPDPDDQLKIEIIESWGYEVEFYEDLDSDTINWNNYDLAYASETIISGDVSANLAGLSIGVVNEEPKLYDDLQLASGYTEHVGSSIDIVDNSHFITSIFPQGPLSIYAGDMEILTADAPLAAGLQTLGEFSGAATLTAIDKGAQTTSGTAVGRRVTLPLGQHFTAGFNWTHLNNNGRLILQRALQWGTGITSGGGLRVLYVVKDPAVLSTQEAARQTLMQGWSFTVTLIDDDDTQANFDAAAAANDVVYISQEMLAGSLGTKLVNTTIGVVNESRDMIDEFGFAASANLGGGLPTLNVDTSHYITSVFTANPVSAYGVNEWYQITSTPVAAGVQPAGVWVDAPWTDLPALMAVPPGADLFGGGTAAGRRVQIPMGAGQGATPVDINGLTDDGRTIIKRAIKWAGGAGCGSLKPLLLMVSDAVSPTSTEIARQTLMASWCYQVTLIDDDATTGELAAAMALNDVIYISQEITTLSVVTKLKDATLGVVNEEYLISSDLGLGSGTGSGCFNDINLVDNTHYITSGFGLGALALFDPSYDIYTGTGFTLAPDLQVLGETGSITGLMALETGGALWASGHAAGRRVQVPWGDDFGALNTDGQTLMRRAIEWAGTAPAPVSNVLLVVGDATTLASKDAGRKALIESWGHTVTLIDDGESQANFDTAAAAADVVYVTASVGGGTLGDKLTGSTTAIVNEFPGKLDNYGFSSSTSATVLSDGFAQTDALHYITEPFSGNPVTVFHTYVYSMPVPSDTLAPDLQNVAEVLATPTLVALETGAQRWDGNPAPARRVHLPFGAAETDQLSADGETIIQRALEWGAGAGAGGGGGGGGGEVVFEEFTEGRNQVGVSAGMSIPEPGGTAVGDLLIVAVATDGNTVSTLSPSASWNLTQLDVWDGAGAVTFGVWWKIADGTEPSSLLMQWTGGEQAYGWIMRFTGHDPSSPIATASMNEGSNRNPLSTNLITGSDGNLILRLGGFDDDDITLDDPGLSGHTAITMDRSNTGNQNTVSGGAGYVIQTTAGDTGTSNFNLTAREQYRTITIAIRPAP